MTKYTSFDGFGVDVSNVRTDDVDRLALQYIADHPQCHVLDLGCGAGGMSSKMAAAGARVIAIDQFNFAKQFEKFDVPVAQLRFIQGDITELASHVPGQMFDLVLLQRTIHYVPYSQALQLLQQVRSQLNGTLFISVTGADSLVAEMYPDSAVAIENRFAKLSAIGQEMFSITEPVCLYSKPEFMHLLTTAGFAVTTCWVSAFGNVKAVCTSVDQRTDKT